jgi:hypothetical protein
MGLCFSKSSDEDSNHKRDLHTAGLHPGDTPYPVKLVSTDGKPRQGTPVRRPSTTPSSAKSSAPPSIIKPPRLMIPTPEMTPLDQEDIDLELYDTCPTPYPSSNHPEKGAMFDTDLSLMAIEFITATVDGRNVKDQLDKMISDTAGLHLQRGLRTILGMDPGKEDEIFYCTYRYRSLQQLHQSCDKKNHFVLRAPKGLQLRIICVSHRGHDYVAAANSLLKEDNTRLDIPAGRAEEMLKCLPSHSSLTLEAPFLFTFVLESEVVSKTCGILCPFDIPKYVPLVDDVTSQMAGVPHI